KGPVVIDRSIDALDVQIFSLRSRVIERQALEGTKFRDVSQQGRQNSRAQTRLEVVLAPLLFIVGTGKTIQELPSGEIGCLAHELFLMRLQRDLGHLRNQPADREAIRTH